MAAADDADGVEPPCVELHVQVDDRPDGRHRRVVRHDEGGGVRTEVERQRREGAAEAADGGGGRIARDEGCVHVSGIGARGAFREPAAT